MKKLLGMYKRYLTQFREHWGYYILVMIGTSLVIGQLVVPLLTWFAQKTMDVADIPYLSYTNIIVVMKGHPLVALVLLVIAILTLLAAYLQFSFWMAIVAAVRSNQGLSAWKILKGRLQDLRHLRISTMLITFVYLIVVVPFSKTMFQSELLSKITIPVFILDDMWVSYKIWIPIVALTTIAIFLSIRLISFLPRTIDKNESTVMMIKNSWRDSKDHFFKIAFKLIASSFFIGMISVVVQALLYASQSYFDQHVSSIALGTAVVSMMFSEVLNQILMAMGIVFIINIALDEFDGQIAFEGENQLKSAEIKLKKIKRFSAVGLIVIISLIAAVYNFTYFKGALIDPPLVIAHRGVDNHNGVQNTIPALEKTAKEKPDFVEMDIHETKDHQFVVMHDGNLKALAGVNENVHDLTLAELTKLTVSEDGESAKIPSFDDYMAAAEKSNQKLLVEIKTSNEDSPDMVSNFLKKYQKRMLADGDYMHSLSYPVIQAVKRQVPQITSSFILPYNLAFPRTQADAYTMEETTLTEEFMDQAHRRDKKVFAWTVDDPTQMQRLLFLNVDGIITDNTSDLQQVIKDNKDHPSYANQLMIYTNQLHGMNGTPQN